jgi:hypothetical protein
MIFTILYSIFWFLLLSIPVRYARAFRIPDLSPWFLSAGFLLKFIAGFIFTFIYIQFYGRGEITGDAGLFMYESHLLQQVFFVSPEDYFSLLTGIGETSEMAMKYLSETRHWSAGNMSIVNDSKNVVRINSLLQFISLNNPLVHMVIFSFLALIGIRDLTLTFQRFTRLKNKWLLCGLLLMPGLLFWGSSMLKEPLLILGLGVFLRAVLSPDWRLRKRLLRGSIGLLLLIGIKPYILLCMLPAIAYFLLAKYVWKQHPLRSLLLLSGFAALLVWAMPTTRDTATHYLARKQFDFDNVGKGGLHVLTDSCFFYFPPADFSKLDIRVQDTVAELKEPVQAYRLRFGSMDPVVPIYLKPDGTAWPIYYFDYACDSYIQTTPIRSSFTQLLRNIPEALINALLRPFPNDPGSWFKYPVMLESWGILALFLFAVFSHRKTTLTQKKLLIAIGIFTFCLLLLIGWTTPVIGAIARYRLPAYVGLFLISIILIPFPQSWNKTDP